MDRPLDRRAAAWALLLLQLAALVLFGRFLQDHDWEWGRARCALLAALALATILGRSPARIAAGSRVLQVLLAIAALIALGVNARTGIETIVHAAKTSEIRLDQGQNTLRAARLLLRGEDPYARGQLLDLEAYITRFSQRAEVGLLPGAPPPEVRPLAERWWQTLDPGARERLLPEPVPPSAAANRERALYGYKYGPILFLVTAPLQALCGPAAVPLLQLILWCAWMALLGLALRAAGVGAGGIALALVAIALEPNVAANALYQSASDVWPLAFMAGAVLAWLRGRPVALGLCAAAAVGCKVLPSALLAPLLFMKAPREGAAFSWAAPLAALAGVLVLFVPFALWDPLGLWADLVLWPSAMRPDNTHWSFYASETVRAAARVALLTALAAAAVWLLRSQPRSAAVCFRWLAAASAAAILAGVAFHNNYAPWFTTWAACAAVASAFGSSESASAQAPAASTNT